MVRFDYTPEETDGLVKLAKCKPSSRCISCPSHPSLIRYFDLSANFKSGEKELTTLIRGLWMRKRQRRLDSEANSGAGEP